MTKLYVVLFQEKKKNEDFHRGHCTKEMSNLLKVQRIYLRLGKFEGTGS